MAASLISAVTVAVVLIGVIICIATEKVNRAVISLLGALICYFVIIFIEKAGFGLIIEFLFGSAQDGFVNLHSLIIILGMMIIVQVSHEAGLFQFFALTIIKLTKGKSILIIVTLCAITVLISSVLNNILTVMILIPLTIMISRILSLNPIPYILMEAILVNIGGTLFPISSIPNILITTSAGIQFAEFFINVGLMSLLIFGITLMFFIFMFKGKVTDAVKEMSILQEFNPWNYVQSKSLLIKSLVTLLGVMACFIIIPPALLPPDIIALLAGIILLLVSKLKPENVMTKLNLELLLYLMGVFVITGAMEYVGIVEVVAGGLSWIAGDNPFILLITVLWFSSYLSAAIDNIPITKVLIPIVDVVSSSVTVIDKKMSFYALAVGANWGDNLTPLGDNILVMNLAQQHNRPLKFKEFFKLGFITTNIQLYVYTIYLSLLFYPLIAMILIGAGIAVIAIVYTRKVASKREEEVGEKRYRRILSRFRRLRT